MESRFIKTLAASVERYPILRRPVLALIAAYLFLYHLAKSMSKLLFRWQTGAVAGMLLSVCLIMVFMDTGSGQKNRYTVELYVSDGIDYEITGMEYGLAEAGSEIKVRYSYDGEKAPYITAAVVDENGNMLYENRIKSDNVAEALYESNDGREYENFEKEDSFSIEINGNISIYLGEAVEVEDGIYFVMYSLQNEKQYEYEEYISQKLEIVNTTDERSVFWTMNTESPFAVSHISEGEISDGVFAAEAGSSSFADILFMEGMDAGSYAGHLYIDMDIYFAQEDPVNHGDDNEEPEQEECETSVNMQEAGIITWDAKEEAFEIEDSETQETSKISHYTFELKLSTVISKKKINEINIPDISEITYGQPLSDSMFISSGENGTYRFETEGKYYGAGIHEVFVIFYPNGDMLNNYDYSGVKWYNDDINAVRALASVNVKKAPLRISVPDNIIYEGEALPVIDIDECDIDGWVYMEKEKPLELSGKIIYSEYASDTAGVYEAVYPAIELDNYEVVFEGGMLEVRSANNVENMENVTSGGGESMEISTEDVLDNGTHTGSEDISEEIVSEEIEEVSEEISGQISEEEEGISEEISEEEEGVSGEILEEPEEISEEITEADMAIGIESTIIMPEAAPMIKVYMPSGINIYIDPYNTGGREQIYTDDIIIENRGDNSINIAISSIILSYNSSDALMGITKKSELYLRRSDGEKLLLNEGINDCSDFEPVPSGVKTGSGEKVILSLTGSVSEGSEMLWRDGDISVKIIFKITAAEDDHTAVDMLD